MRVLLFEQWDGGHYFNYLDCLLPELSRLSGELVLAVNPVMQEAVRASEKWRGLSNVSFTTALPPVPPALAAADRRAATTNLLLQLRAVRPDFTLLPSADAQTMGMSLLDTFGRLESQIGSIEGTLHYGYGFSATGVKDRIKELIYSRTYRFAPYSSVNFVNFAYYEYVMTRGIVGPDRLRCVGDPVPQPARIGRAAARELLGLDPAHRYIGLFGSLDRRKAVPELLAAFRAASLGRTDHLVLGGRLDRDYARLIADRYGDMVDDGRLVVMDRFLTSRELESAYEALDVAALAYYRFPGLASLALKAVAAGTPLVVHDFGWMRALVRRFGVGETTDIFDVARFANSLRTSLEASGQRAPDAAVARLLKFHEQDNFVARMTSGLRRAIGSPPVPSVDWEWVLEALPPQRRSLT